MTRDGVATRVVPECTGACCELEFSPENLGWICQLAAAGDREGRFVVERMLQGRDHGTCALLVEGRCSVYETRPRVCRAYPYGDACEHCGGVGEVVDP